MQLEHQVTRKTGYITNSIYTRGTRDERRLDQAYDVYLEGKTLLR